MEQLPPLVDAAWLARHRDEVVLADVRAYLDGRDPAEEYARGHLAGAVRISVEDVLSGPVGPATGRHPLPSPERFAEGLGAAGIGDGSTVVAYDDAGGVMAARLVWMLRAVGHRAALLDGGLRPDGSAPDALGPVTTEVPDVPPTTLTPRPWPADLLAGADDAADRRNVVLDARPTERYAGLSDDPVDARPGHVPGARSLPTREQLDADGRLLPPEVLRARFEAAGAGAGAPVVAYCGSGVTACHLLLAREHVGLGRGRLYPGSWSEWARSDRPAETGAPAHDDDAGGRGPAAGGS